MNKNPGHKPPQWSTGFLKWFLKPEYYEDIQGDLEEEYAVMVAESPAWKARQWYNWQIIRLYRPSMHKRLKTQNSIEKETTMFRNYLKIGFRNLWKYKSSSVINAIGLSTGIAAFVLIALFVKDEFSYDRHFAENDLIYRVTVKNYTPEGYVSRHWAFSSAGHAERLKEDYSDITHSVRFFPWAFPDLEYGDQRFPGQPVIFADNDVFDIFSFPFLVGNPETAFDQINNIVLTEQTAVRIFGNDWAQQDIIGKAITLSRSGQGSPFKVSAVIEDMPDQQHFHFEYLAPLQFIEKLFGEETMNNVGGNYNWLTYIKVSSGTQIEPLTQQTNNEFWDKYIGSFPNGADAREFYDFEFQPLTSIHLHSNLEGEYETNGSLQQVTIFAVVGLLVLLVACVNYMNLATSNYSRRMKEIGVRKVIGAVRRSLVGQFLTESMLITLISLPISAVLVLWALPYLNNFMDKQLSFNPFVQLDILVGLIVLMIIVGLVAGLYPAIFLSKMNLVTALKGEQAVNAKKWNFRSWLVTFQYVVTLALIFSILVIEGQMKYIRNTNPGYDRDQIVHIYLSRSIDNLEVFKQQLLSDPSIQSGTYASRIPTGRLLDSWGSSFFKGDSLVATNFRLPAISVDEDFLPTFDIPLIAGDNFNREQDSFRDSIGYYIINRKAAEALGFNDPNDIIGERLVYGPFNGQTNEDGTTFKIGRIMGVSEDYHFESLHTEIVPMVMLKSQSNVRRIALKISPTDIPKTLNHIENTWAEFDSENPIEYRFLDDMFNEQYQAEQRLSTMIKVFTFVAILIGCLGLVGMVGFVIETKIKEIGIRKVLGASTSSIWMLVGNRFLILITIGFFIALPISYWLMNQWLENFVYRTGITVWMIVLPLLIASLLTLISISYQTIRASTVNPVKYLKDE